MEGSQHIKYHSDLYLAARSTVSTVPNLRGRSYKILGKFFLSLTREFWVFNRKEILLVGRIGKGEKYLTSYHCGGYGGAPSKPKRKEAVCEVAIAAGMAYFRIYILSVHQLASVDITRTGEMYLRGNSSGRKIAFYLGRGQSAQQCTRDPGGSATTMKLILYLRP